MRTWFYRHPNVVGVLLGISALCVCYYALADLGREQWGWFVVDAISFVTLSQLFRTWWDRT